MKKSEEKIINQLDSTLKDIVGFNPFIALNRKNAKYGRNMIYSKTFYFDMLSLIAQSRFKWKNIPVEIPNYQLERCLFYSGMAGITFDDVVDEYVILPVVYTSAGLNIYGEPKKFTLFSYNTATHYPNLENNKGGTICYNNNIKKSDLYLANRYAERLKMIDEITDMNIDKQRCPYIILCEDKQELLSLKTLLKDIRLGTEAVTQLKDLTNDIKTLDLKVELKSNDLLQAKREIFNEACLYLGVTSNLSNKKERMITSEVENEEAKASIYREIALQPRKYFCQKVNKLYGLNIDVEFFDEEAKKLINDFNKQISKNTDNNLEE